MRLSRRLQDLAQSDIRRMTRECECVNGINLGQVADPLPQVDAVHALAFARHAADVRLHESLEPARRGDAQRVHE